MTNTGLAQRHRARSEIGIQAPSLQDSSLQVPPPPPNSLFYLDVTGNQMFLDDNDEEIDGAAAAGGLPSLLEAVLCPPYRWVSSFPRDREP